MKEIEVHNAAEALKIILSGNERWTMSSTVSNEFSSRSHAVILISLERRPDNTSRPIITSKLSIVDLAGSEKDSADIKE